MVSFDEYVQWEADNQAIRGDVYNKYMPRLIKLLDKWQEKRLFDLPASGPYMMRFEGELRNMIEEAEGRVRGCS